MASDKPQRCILYISKSPSILEEKIDALKRSAKEKVNVETDYKVFYGTEDLDESELINYLSTPSFFSDMKIAVIKDIGKAPAKSLKRFSEFLYESREGEKNFSVIMTSQDNRIPKDLKESIKSCCRTIRINEPSEKSLGKWLDERSELDGISFSVKARQELLDCVGNDLSNLKKEYEKLYTYILDDKGRKIDQAAVTSLVRKTYTLKVYDMIDYIGARDKNGAFSVFKAVLEEKQNPIGLVVLIYRMFKTMLYLKAEKDPDRAEAYMDSNIKNVSPYFRKKLLSRYKGYAQKYTLSEIKEIFRMLNFCDMDLRSSIAEPQKIIQRLIFDIIDLNSA